jgi:predicted RNA binding protein YcfA (HicA-like mRNA interferase family)
MKVRDLIERIEDDGCHLVGTRRSNRQYRHPRKSGRVTVSGHPSDEVHPRTLQSVLTPAHLRRSEEHALRSCDRERPRGFLSMFPIFRGASQRTRRWTRSSPTFVEPPSFISRGCARTVCRYRNRLLAANTLKPLRNLEPRTDSRLDSQ